MPVVVLQLFRLQENHMQLIQAYQLKENELESYRRLLEMHGIWVSIIISNLLKCYFYYVIRVNQICFISSVILITF